MPTTAVAAFIIYCLGRPTCWLCCLMTHDKSIMPIILVIDSPRSIATPNTAFDCCFAVAMAIAVVGLRSGRSSINNRINTFYIKTIANTTSFPSLNCPHVCVHSFPPLHHPRCLVKDCNVSCCLLTCGCIDYGPFRDCTCRSAFRCCVLLSAYSAAVLFACHDCNCYCYFWIAFRL